MKVARLDGKLAVELPDDVIATLDLREGDDVEMQLTRSADRTTGRMAREEALERLKGFRNLLPADYKFDREEANAR